MNFSDPQKVASVITQLKEADQSRAKNRSLVNDLYNGKPPYTMEEERENNIRVNVNWGEGADLMLQAREQYENAHLTPNPIIKITVPSAPPSEAAQTGNTITAQINKLVSEDRQFFHSRREKFASVALHGIGPFVWWDSFDWRPSFVGIDSVLIPTSTGITFEDMNHFAIRREMTAGKLFRMTFGRDADKRDPGWNLDLVKKVFNQIKNENSNASQQNWTDNPEAMAELWKQNSSFYDSDAIPKIVMWDFYHQEDDNESTCWYRDVILDTDCGAKGTSDGDSKVKFIYHSNKAYAQSLDEIMQCQFADGNNVPPFKYHSVRSLGLRLFDVIHMLNRLRCQFLQKVFEDLMNLFRVQDPSDKARLEQIYMGPNYAVVPEGLNFVKREDRYSPDARLVEMQLSNMKQLAGEGSQQYTQDIDSGTNKERTAFEVSTLLNQSLKLTTSMLNLSYMQELFMWKEICRRLTVENPVDFAVKKFQKSLQSQGVSSRFINSDLWAISVTRVLGSGNSQLAAAQAKALMEIRPLLGSEAQDEVTHDYVLAITNDPSRAERIAPMHGAPRVTDSIHDAELTFGALMAGVQVAPKAGLNPIDVIKTLLKHTGEAVQRINATGGVGDRKELIGLFNATMFTKYWIQQLAQDKAQAEAVRNFMNAIGNIENLLKAFTQRLDEKEKAEQAKAQGDPAAMMKIQTDAMASKQKMELEQQSHRQDMVMKSEEHRLDMQIKNREAAADLSRKNAQAKATLASQKAKDSVASKTADSE